jgi:MT0933-like antitoxin protein
VPDISGMADEAKNLASEHPDVANKGIEEAGQVAGEKTGGRFDSQIEQGEQKAEGFLGTDSQGGGQDQQAGNQ